MNYLAIVLLIVIVILILPNRKVYSIEEIKLKDPDIKGKIDKIKSEDSLFIKTKYKLSEQQKEIIIANYIVNGYRSGVIEYKYKCTGKNILKKIIVTAINYIHIFNKNSLSSASIKFISKEKDEPLNYFTSDYFTIDISRINIRDIINKANYKISPKNVVIVFLTILSNTIITTNVIYYIFNFKGLYELICAMSIYFCYYYINYNIYRVIGRAKVLSTYLFPVYLLLYTGYAIYINIFRRIN